MNWMPIETAPRETEVLVYDTTGLMHVAMLGEAGKWETRDLNEVSAVHWMPIPAPPEVSS